MQPIELIIFDLDGTLTDSLADLTAATNRMRRRFGRVEFSPEQVRQLEEMDRDERAEMVTEIVREVHTRGFQARFGRLRDDGRLGGPDE